MGIRTNAQNDKRTLKNELYSVVIPSDWFSQEEGGRLGKRELRNYHLYSLLWRTPIGKPYISLFIRSYQKKDGSPIMIKEIRTYEITPMSDFLVKDRLKEISVTPNRERVNYVKISDEGTNKVVPYCVFCLFVKNGNMVHSLSISMREVDYLQIKPQKMIDDIFNSFSINNKIKKVK